MKENQTNSSALLIIDMQKGSFTPATPRYDTKGVVKRINQLAAGFREYGNPVIYIQHNGSKQNCFVPGTEEWEILDDLNIAESDLVVYKTANDTFYESDLEEKLKELNVSELVITGCATDFCVESTIQSALIKDFNITVVKDAHTTADRPHLSAEKVIEHYNWVWSDLIPTKGRVEVVATAEILFNT
ncbi:cysteine hydrolase family protein [Labilibaculum euxinus]|uniref:Isochorismatase family protein n=1 Tax=Labilibaculum euxinus TaxID=2686357 RepID=A0A7M4DAU9_9BACT|nr:cysteine hydrolase family protein [Labilibaculum euxinus]MUP39778.1 isochorismatase family protein [Labilibaculum euxinus]MVB08983.1 isochorismatase family protein [Labilibaculum euxinus]